MFNHHEETLTAPNEEHRAARRSNLIWRGERWEAPENLHRRSLLIHVVRGALHCEADNNVWITPPTMVLWLPGGTLHNAYAYGDFESYAVWVDASYSTLGGSNDCQSVQQRSGGCVGGALWS